MVVVIVFGPSLSDVDHRQLEDDRRQQCIKQTKKVRSHRVLQGVAKRGPQFCFIFCGSPNPFFKASKRALSTLKNLHLREANPLKHRLKKRELWSGHLSPEEITLIKHQRFEKGVGGRAVGNRQGPKTQQEKSPRIVFLG